MSGSSYLQREKVTYAGLVAQRELMSVARQGGSDATVPEGSKGLDARVGERAGWCIPVGLGDYVARSRSVLRDRAVTNTYRLTVSAIDVKTRTKRQIDIAVGTDPIGVVVTPCRQ